MAIIFKFLEAGSGDAILISVDDKNILVDGGDNYELLYCPLDSLKTQQQRLDLVILTHQDDDHINGLVDLLADEEVRGLVQEIWFNSHEHDNIFRVDSTTQTGTRQAIKFDKLVQKLKEENDSFTYRDCLHTGKYSPDSPINIFKDTKMSILSPTQQKLQDMYEKYIDEKRRLSETKSSNTSGTISDNKKTLEELAQEKFKKDTSVSNGSSIAFLLTYKDKYNFLLLGDAHIDVITYSLRQMGYSKENKLAVQLVKLSHHGSKHNIHQEFLELIDTDTFIISTNGNHDHPNAATLSKIILNPGRDKNKNVYFKFNDENVCRKFSEIKAFEADNQKKHHFSFMYLGNDDLKFW